MGMINDAEKFAEEDAELKSKVEARNELESYAYSLKNQLSDKEKLGGKLSDDEQSKIEEIINEKIQWLEDNADASAEDLKAQKKDREALPPAERKRTTVKRMSCKHHFVIEPLH